MTNIINTFKKHRFRKQLKRLSDTELIDAWTLYLIASYYESENKTLRSYLDLVQEEIYRIDDLKPYIERVEEFGLSEILLPWFVLREFLFYAIDKSGEDDTGIIRRVKNGNLRAYLDFSVFPLMSEEMRKMVSADDVDYVVELMESYA